MGYVLSLIVMGKADFFPSVPKFFRWLSERYPAISQLIAENRIPEFDNLYVLLTCSFL